MNLTTVNVAISVQQLIGVALPGGSVRFELTKADINGALVLPKAVTVALPTDGSTATARLWPNTLGTQGSQTKFTVLDQAGVEQFSGLATIPATDCNLHDVMNLQAPPVVSDAQAAANVAQAAAAAAQQASVDAPAVHADRLAADASAASAAHIYAGTYASDPTTRPDGSARQVGDEYFNNVANLSKRFNGTTWAASDINTANLAAASGATLIGYQAEDGSATIVQARLRGLDTLTGYKKRKYVVVITGQSNAAGARNDGPNPASSLVKVWDGVTHAWGSSDFTQNPMARAYPDGNVANNNVALARAHRIADDTGAQVFIIYEAWGGRPIEDWMGAGTASVRYAGLKVKVQAALATPELSGITKIDELIWFQGEENGLTDDYTAYIGKLATLDAQFRAETWINPTTPMLIMGMSNLHTRYDPMAAQKDYCENVNRNCVWVNSSGLLTDSDVPGAGSDGTHLRGISLWEHGYYRIASAMAERGMSHGSHLPAFASRGAGPWRGQPDAIARFVNLVSYESRTGGIGVTDAFNGDGATAAFTLTIVGGTIASVTVGGVAKVSPADYSVVGQTITFTAAPAVGVANIVVTYSQTINGPAASGSISWGYRCSAAGNYTMAGGYLVTTDNLCNYAAGWGREITFNASGDYSGAFGYQNAINASWAFAAGRGHTIAVNGGVGLGLFPKYTDGSRLFQYGIGTSSSAGSRKNAIAVAAAGNVELLAPSTGTDPGQNEELTFRRIDDTHLKVVLRGADATVRSANIAISAGAGTDIGGVGSTASGTYAPTVSSATNCDSTPTVAGARFMQAGTIVHVSGTVTVDATVAGDTLFKVTLPVASNLAATSDLSGVVNAYTASALSGGAVIGSVADDLAQFRINATSTSARDYVFSFSYEVK